MKKLYALSERKDDLYEDIMNRLQKLVIPTILIWIQLLLSADTLLKICPRTIFRVFRIYILLTQFDACLRFKVTD